MRVIFGIILGVALTVGAAYLYDSRHALLSENSTAQRPVVNWDVVSIKWNHLTEKARAEWARLAKS
jgi:hypothetical protein